MPTPEGRLERVPLRDCWANEAGDFTPWLAQEANLKLLSDLLDMDLQLVGTEQRGGAFAADIVCVDLSSEEQETRVVIENQLARTDHGHLGQILTYARSHTARALIWIAERFTEEHRATVDWLNEVTDDRVSIFGLEIELWRIGHSPVAPKFNVVCKPNEWARSSRSPAGGSTTEFKQMQLEYWTQLSERMAGHPSAVGSIRPHPRQHVSVPLGRSGCRLRAFMNSHKQLIGVHVVLSGDHAAMRYEMLLSEREAIEEELGSELMWSEPQTQKRGRIGWDKAPVDVQDTLQWPDQHAWLHQALEAIYTAFASRIRQLDPDALADDSVVGNDD